MSGGLRTNITGKLQWSTALFVQQKEREGECLKMKDKKSEEFKSIIGGIVKSMEEQGYERLIIDLTLYSYLFLHYLG